MATLACGHQICSQDLLRLLESDGTHNACPQCRAAIPIAAPRTRRPDPIALLADLLAPVAAPAAPDALVRAAFVQQSQSFCEVCDSTKARVTWFQDAFQHPASGRAVYSACLPAVNNA